MRLFLAAVLLLGFVQPAAAQADLPEGVEQLLACGHVYSLRSQDAAMDRDEDAALEYFNMSEALLWQARSTLESAGYSDDDIEDIDISSAMTTGFSYGAGDGDKMVQDCLAAWDSP